ncbi:hypothetical protein C8Q74DRAFT_1370047 [Fomes fomentarius]|nr:hypothetical protein C8Q74DRAFT_1370047 [Fomes fomentarius]
MRTKVWRTSPSKGSRPPGSPARQQPFSFQNVERAGPVEMPMLAMGASATQVVRLAGEDDGIHKTLRRRLGAVSLPDHEDEDDDNAGDSCMALPGSADGHSAEQRLLVGVFQDLQVVLLNNVAAVAWVAFDILVTFPQEVSLIWKAKWSIPKVLYFLVRYYTLISLLFVKNEFISFVVRAFLIKLLIRTHVSLSGSCKTWLWFNTFNGTLLSAVVGEAMFLMRLYASYQRNKLIMTFVGLVYAIQIIVGTVTGTLIMSRIRVLDPIPQIPLPGCRVTAPTFPVLSILSWIIALLSACLYFVLVLLKFTHNISLRREAGTASSVPIYELQTISPLIYSFLRDSAFYFFLVFAGNAINLAFVLMYRDRPLIMVGTIWLGAMYAISASRLCLNTREELQRRRYQCDTGWFDDIELHDQFTSPSLASDPHTRSGPAIVFQSGVGKVSLQRNTFESESRREPPSPAFDSSGKCSRTSVDNYELMAVAPWIIMEQPREYK